MNEKLEIVKHDIQEASQKYLQNPIRAAIVAIPIIGSSIDAMITIQGQKFQQKRLDRFVEYTTDEIKNINENMVDRNFLKSEEFYDNLSSCLDKCTRTRFLENINIIAQIFVGSILVGNRDDREFTKDFLNAIGNLHPEDLKLGILIYHQQRNNLPNKFDEKLNQMEYVTQQGWDKLLQESGFEISEFRIRLYNLTFAGLIKEVIRDYVGYHDGRKYIITDLFIKLMDFIKYSKNPLFSSKVG